MGSKVGELEAGRLIGIQEEDGLDQIVEDIPSVPLR